MNNYQSSSEEGVVEDSGVEENQGEKNSGKKKTSLAIVVTCPDTLAEIACCVQDI